jgi:hypothetical protein
MHTLFGDPGAIVGGPANLLPDVGIQLSTPEVQENLMADVAKTRTDEGMGKGAVEDDAPYPDGERRPQHGSLSGQLGHRDQDEMLKDNDTDFPGLDAEAEHSGK